MSFAKRFPRIITGLIGLALLALTAAIVGLEIYGDYLDLAHGTIWQGLWSALVFIPTFLAMLFITCCCRGRYCAFYVLILVVASAALGVVIIYFDQYFMNNICKCYLGNQICCALHSVQSLQQNYSNVLENCASLILNNAPIIDTCSTNPPTSKLPYIKAQLGCAAGLVVTCAVYVVLFLFACFGVCFGHD